jgi:hypothetical protein
MCAQAIDDWKVIVGDPKKYEYWKQLGVKDFSLPLNERKY